MYQINKSSVSQTEMAFIKNLYFQVNVIHWIWNSAWNVQNLILNHTALLKGI